MKLFDHVKFLGMHWSESGLQPLVDAHAITKAPKLPKGDTDAYVELKKLGLFLIFSDERTINIPRAIFPDGALTPSNITFYLTSKSGYKGGFKFEVQHARLVDRSRSVFSSRAFFVAGYSVGVRWRSIRAGSA